MPIITHTVTEKHISKRLDIYIAHYEPYISRNRIQSLIKSGLALVDGKKEKPGYKVKRGENITLELPERKVHDVLPEAISLSVLYEDPHIIVLNKPPGLVVHPAPGNYTGTLVNALLYHYGSLPSRRPLTSVLSPQGRGLGEGRSMGADGDGRERAGIVHRLDKDTSGVMVVARTQEALRSLSTQFKNRVVRKRYVALVAGVIKKGSGTIEVGLGRHVKERKKMSTHTHHAREAITSFIVKERYPKATLVEVEIKTGRTHQIRVHLAHIGHPVLGDHVYGGGKATQFGETIITRQMLHAETLSLIHPDSGEPMSFTAPLPADMDGVIDRLRKTKSP
ncbi:MAG: RluA family pseudouridine synthase [Nitrospirota bacterium]